MDVTDPAAREALVDWLRDDGCPDEEIEAALEQGRLPLLPLERVFERPLSLSNREVLERTGLSERYMHRNYLALGLAWPDLDEEVHSEDELETYVVLKSLLDVLPEEHVLELTRVVGHGIGQLSSAVLHTFLDLFIEEDDPAYGVRLAQIVEHFMPVMGRLLSTPLRHHMRQLVRYELVDRASDLGASMRGTREVSVAFADCVSFTEMTDRSGSAYAGAVADRLEEMALEVTEPPVRLVKLIGDAAMFVSPRADALVETVARLMAAMAADPEMPELRAGLTHGPAFTRGGDWYGNPVNAASRVSDLADPGELWATEAVVRDAPDGWEPRGTHRLKGVERPVELWARTT